MSTAIIPFHCVYAMLLCALCCADLHAHTFSVRIISLYSRAETHCSKSALLFSIKYYQRSSSSCGPLRKQSNTQTMRNWSARAVRLLARLAYQTRGVLCPWCALHNSRHSRGHNIMCVHRFTGRRALRAGRVQRDKREQSGIRSLAGTPAADHVISVNI